MDHSFSLNQRAWIVSVSMGYGHQRTAFPLKKLAPRGEIINANNYEGISKTDREIWEGSRKFYEFISNFYRIPFLGRAIFSFFDQFQKIYSFYPKRDLTKPNFQSMGTFSLIKKGWGKDLIERLTSRQLVGGGPLPLISTFFTPAFMAEFFDYPGEIFCIICDADIARTWAPLNPSLSRLKYFTPTERTVERLKSYGVRPENIFLTGYPLPLENLGSENLEILKEDLKCRLFNLDPRRKYFEKYKILIETNLGNLPEKPEHPLTLMFSVGGAGAQKEIGIKVLKCLNRGIEHGEIKVVLSAGVKAGVKEYFEKNIQKLGLNNCLGKNIEIIFEKDMASYFQKFNLALRKTDILWTKPSELSFYAALGLPIIISPPIGSQEDFNKRWLLKSGFGIMQEDPDYINQWLFDWLNMGYLAEAAMQGFIEGEKLGTFNIAKIISKYAG